jgi:hypothetical protein
VAPGEEEAIGLPRCRTAVQPIVLSSLRPSTDDRSSCEFKVH